MKEYFLFFICLNGGNFYLEMHHKKFGCLKQKKKKKKEDCCLCGDSTPPPFVSFIMTHQQQPQQPQTKRVAVVGVGSVGLTAIKWCLERKLDVVGFDKEEGCGGVWRWGSGHSPAYDSLCTNSSKTLMNLSDFPFNFEIEV